MPIVYAETDPDRAVPEVVLVSQYRAAHDEMVIEIPAGVRDIDGEADEDNARRELVEEVGLRPGRLELLTSIYPSAGMTDSVNSIFLATDCTPAQRSPHGPEEEHAEIIRLPLAEAIEWVEAGRIVDAKSVVGLLLAERRLRMMNHVELPIEAEEFLSWLLSERGRAANTLAAYRRDLTAYAAWLDGRGKSLETVSTEDLFELIAERRRQRSAPSTIARQLAAIRSLHRFLVNEDYRGDDPTADVEGSASPPGSPRRSPRTRSTPCSRPSPGTTRSPAATGRCSNCSTEPERGSPRCATCRWATSTSRDGSSACSARAPRNASSRSGERRPTPSTTGSPRAAGTISPPPSGGAATTPTPCSSTPGAAA